MAAMSLRAFVFSPVVSGMVPVLLPIVCDPYRVPGPETGA
jgi:hypothetical protein